MRFIELPIGSGTIYVNPDTVRMVWPAQGQATLYFDQNHTTLISAPASDVVKKLVGGSLE